MPDRSATGNRNFVQPANLPFFNLQLVAKVHNQTKKPFSALLWPTKPDKFDLLPAAGPYPKNCPVMDTEQAATCAGVPQTTTSPPASPPSGPRSIIQSADLSTSRLCSITTTECP
ncbi:hypothetical protein MFFC18_14440 [Mariniblastus fucicola]|uniref:Uncharacterized protein n=1 Tax=Mariniblastus fucicola TaxID=980251 RepID=A0A5B9PAR3_9BACT|nr:hypothetical protein MFFC18_14440 [Mariniblastus fucicola]